LALLLGAFLPAHIDLLRFTSDSDPVMMKNGSLVPIDVQAVTVVFEIYGGTAAKVYGAEGFRQSTSQWPIDETIAPFEAKKLSPFGRSSSTAANAPICQIPNARIDDVKLTNTDLYPVAYWTDEPEYKLLSKAIPSSQSVKCAIRVDYKKNLYLFEIPQEPADFPCAGYVKANTQKFDHKLFECRA